MLLKQDKTKAAAQKKATPATPPARVAAAAAAEGGNDDEDSIEQELMNVDWEVRCGTVFTTRESGTQSMHAYRGQLMAMLA